MNLLDRLNQYKEIIALIVFFLGGLSWIYGYFATKKQVDILECLLEKNVSLVESKLQVIYFTEQRNKKIEETFNLSKNDDERSRFKIDLIKSDLRLVEEQLKLSSEQLENSNNHLKKGLCRRS